MPQSKAPNVGILVWEFVYQVVNLVFYFWITSFWWFRTRIHPTGAIITPSSGVPAFKRELKNSSLNSMIFWWFSSHVFVKATQRLSLYPSRWSESEGCMQITTGNEDVWRLFFSGYLSTPFQIKASTRNGLDSWWWDDHWWLGGWLQWCCWEWNTTSSGTECHRRITQLSPWALGILTIQTARCSQRNWRCT